MTSRPKVVTDADTTVIPPESCSHRKYLLLNNIKSILVLGAESALGMTSEAETSTGFRSGVFRRNYLSSRRHVMIKKILTVLLIEDSPEYAELVQRWLTPTDDVEFVLNWTDSLMTGLSRLAKGGVDVILLDLGLPDSRGLKTFTTAQMHAPGVPIVVLSGGDTHSLALQMVQQGAQDHIVKSTSSSELLIKALQYAVVRSAQKTSEEIASDQRTVIGVMGAKGGVGATTFACNLAVELRRQTDQATLLADLDVNSGLVSFFMNTEAEHSILDAAVNIQRLDVSLWDGIVSHGPSGVDIVRSPNLLGSDNPDVRNIPAVLGVIRRFYRWTVLDLGRVTALSISLLDKVNELYLVTTVSVSALHEAKRTIGALIKAGLKTDCIRPIVNQVGTVQEVSQTELGHLFGVPVYASLPGAARELEHAWVEGKLLGANSDYRARIAGLARKTAGLAEEMSGGTVAHLLSFAGKFRRNIKDVAAATLT
jgi:Flp pilus assembly CpaE family ATPase